MLAPPWLRLSGVRLLPALPLLRRSASRAPMKVRSRRVHDQWMCTTRTQMCCCVLTPAIACTRSCCQHDAGHSAPLRSFAGPEEAQSSKRRRRAAVVDAAYHAERPSGASDAARGATFARSTPPHASAGGGVIAAALVGCKVEGTIEACTPDGGYIIELRTGFHVLRGARSAKMY